MRGLLDALRNLGGVGYHAIMACHHLPGGLVEWACLTPEQRQFWGAWMRDYWRERTAEQVR